MAKNFQDDDTNTVFFDLMTGLMFIFVIALVAYMLNFNDKHSNEMKLQSQLKDVNYLTSNLVQQVSRELKRYNIPHTPLYKEGVVRLSAPVLSFDSGSYQLNSEQTQYYTVVSRILNNTLTCYSEKTLSKGCRGDEAGVIESVVIEGHTDNIPFRGDESAGIRDNRDLSYQRARSVYNLFVSQTDAESLKNRNNLSLLQVAGYGESRPLSGEQSSRAKSEDRRIDVRFVFAKPWVAG